MFKKINSHFEKLFEAGTNQNLALDHSIIEAKKNFEIIENISYLENLSYVFTSEINPEQLTPLFDQISCYFEVNILLKKEPHKKTYIPRDSTIFGKKINNPENWLPISLPETPLFKVFRAPAQNILNHYKLNNIDPEKKMQTYTLRITSNYVLMLTTFIAEPWTKIKIETLQNALMKINYNL